MKLPKKESDALLETARNHYKLACQGFEEQEKREEEDLEFQIPERQWSEAARKERTGGGGIPGVPIPPRPMLSIPKVQPQVSLVENQAAMARLGVQLHPVSEDANDETAEVLEGLYRSIEQDRDYPAQNARLWALKRSVNAGRGYYMVDCVWADDGHPFDQKIILKRILDGSVVKFDPAAQEPDFSDARFCFIAVWMPRDEYVREFGKTKIESQAQADWGGLMTAEPDWVRSEPEPGFLVLTYYYKRYEKETIVLLQDGRVVVDGEEPYSDAAVMLDPDGEPMKRERQKATVCVAKLNADEVLSHEVTDGQYLPIVMVPGNELLPVRAKRRWHGMVRPARDAQMGYNYAVSALVETAALEPKAPFLIAEGQIKGYESWWQQANTRNLPYLPYIPAALGDKQVAPPQRTQADTSKMGPSAMLIEQFDRDIQATTASYDLGWLRNKERSGRAIRALQEQADASNSTYIQQLAMAMGNEARIILDLIPKKYDRPGRIARIIGAEDNAKPVMLNAPFVMDQNAGVPRRVAAQRPGNGQPAALPQGAKFYDLRKGSYAVTVSIGKATQSLRQEAAEEMGTVIQAAPQLLPVLGPEYFDKRDFNGAQQIAKILRKLRDKQYPFLAEDDEGQGSPEQWKAQAQAAQQQLQAMQQQMQQMVEALKQEQIKYQAQLQKAQLDNQTKLQIEQLKIANDQKLAEMEALVKIATAGAEREHDEKMAGAQHGHERAMGAADTTAELMLALSKPNPVRADAPGLGSDTDDGIYER